MIKCKLPDGRIFVYKTVKDAAVDMVSREVAKSTNSARTNINATISKWQTTGRKNKSSIENRRTAYGCTWSVCF